MEVFRISREKYIKDISGIGAKLSGGRWNPKGYAVLYSSEHKSLAALEVLVHLNKNTVPDDLKVISLAIPDNYIDEFDEKKFNKILKQIDSNQRLKNEGTNWLDSKKSLALKVPSILIPGEKNIIINPEHKAFKEIQILSIENFVFDERFFI